MRSKPPRPTSPPPTKLYLLIAAAFMLVAQTRSGFSQQVVLSGSSSDALPDAPMGTAPGPQQELAKGSATLSGAIVDQTGASVHGAKVALVGADGVLRVVRSGDDGSFTFSDLPAGMCHFMVEATGFAPVSSLPISLRDNETIAAPVISLLVAANNTEVEVRGDTEQVANEQIKAAEKQRILGFVPNFYTSFVYEAVPLTPKQKYKFALRETFDPIRFVGTGVGAGIEQANDNFKGYGLGAAGYGKRYAALYGDGLFSDVLSHAVFPVIFHQDPRYFYQGSGTTRSRFIHAVSFSVMIRNDSGRTVPNYSYILGDLGAGALSNLYYPHADRGAGLVFMNTAIGVAGRAAGSLAREFVLPRLTGHRAGNGRE